MACHIGLYSSASLSLVFISCLLAGVLEALCHAHIAPLHAHLASPGQSEEGSEAMVIHNTDHSAAEAVRHSTVEAGVRIGFDPPRQSSSLQEHRDVDGKLEANAMDPKGKINIEVGTGVETSSTRSSGLPQASSLQQQGYDGKLKADAMDPKGRVSETKGHASSGSNEAIGRPALGFETPSIEYRSPRRSLLPSGTIIKDETEELHSHVVRIRSQSNGVGTGVLLKKNFVLTAKRVVKGFLDPFEFSLELGNETSHGLELFLHISEDLAVIKVHPPFERTGRKAMSGSPKGFFWPLATRDPSPPSALKLFGYGASFFFTSKDYLTYKSFPLSHKSSQNHLLLSSKATIPTTSGDAGGPAFVVRKRGSTLVGIITTSKPRQGELVSVAQHREWVYESMKSTCSREEQTFKRLLVDTDGDMLIYYHCRVERAEQFGVHLTAKSSPCAPGWKAVLIRSNHGKVLTKVETHDKKEKATSILSPKRLKSTSHFFIELWKPKLLGLHTMVSKYGPFNVSDYIDGGLHFEWCQAS